MPLCQLVVGEVSADSKQYKTYQERSRSRHVGRRAVHVVAEEVAESTIDACIEASANRIKGQEADSAGARCSGEGRRYRVDPGDELSHQQDG